MTTAPSIVLVDVLIRGGAGGLLLLVAALLARDFGRVAAARLGAAFAVGSAAYALCSAPGAHSWVGWAVAPVLALAAGNNLVFWLFAKALFDDGFRVRAAHAALWATIVGAALWLHLGSGPPAGAGADALGAALSLQALAFAILAGVLALASWREDLVEPRRRLRLFIVAAAAAHTAATALVHLTLGVSTSAGLSLADAVALAMIAAIVAWSLWGVEGEEIWTTSARAPAAASPAALSPADQALIGDLQRLMDHERAYRQEGLTIGRLAARIGAPEHRLRRLINQGLGYRNFSAFLNYYRLADATAALRDPNQAKVPILTIALDAGFNSLGPFNRAFKAETGQTPTEYRAAARPQPAAPIANPASVPSLKFASATGERRANFGLDEDTSKFMILVWFTNLKFASARSPTIRRTSGSPH